MVVVLFIGKASFNHSCLKTSALPFMSSNLSKYYKVCNPKDIPYYFICDDENHLKISYGLLLMTLKVAYYQEDMFTRFLNFSERKFYLISLTFYPS